MKQFFAAARLILTLKCEHSTKIVSESLDRELSFVERWAVRMHSIACYSCRRFGQQIRLVRDAMRARTDANANEAKLSPSAVQRIQDAVQKSAE